MTTLTTSAFAVTPQPVIPCTITIPSKPYYLVGNSISVTTTCNISLTLVQPTTSLSMTNSSFIPTSRGLYKVCAN